MSNTWRSHKSKSKIKSIQLYSVYIHSTTTSTTTNKLKKEKTVLSCWVVGCVQVFPTTKSNKQINKPMKKRWKPVRTFCFQYKKKQVLLTKSAEKKLMQNFMSGDVDSLTVTVSDAHTYDFCLGVMVIDLRDKSKWTKQQTKTQKKYLNKNKECSAVLSETEINRSKWQVERFNRRNRTPDDERCANKYNNKPTNNHKIQIKTNKRMNG